MLRNRLAALLCAACFLLPGLMFIPYFGIQEDEVMFVIDWFLPEMAVSSFKVGPMRTPAPIMLMSYVGALKSWLYAPLMLSLKPSAWMLRGPALILAAVTIYLFYEFARRACGSRAAWIAAALLATDTSYLLTSCFDWGPSVIQHLLLTGGALLVWRFFDGGRVRHLRAGSFLFGLAVWDKAVFLWMLGGLGLGVGLVYWRQCRRALGPAPAVLAAGAFLAGALPFVAYNAGHGWEAFNRPRVVMSELPGRVGILLTTLEGSALDHALLRDDAPPAGGRLRGIEWMSRWIDSAAGGVSRNPMAWLLAAAVAMLPVLRSKAAFAGLLSLTFAYGFMLISNGGGAAHHVVLLWPLPHFVIAAAGAAALERTPRAVFVPLIGAVCILNLLTTNHYFAGASRTGTGLLWTDASWQLPQALGDMRGRAVLAADWGILGPVVTLTKARFPVYAISDLLTTDTLDAAQQSVLAGAIATPSNVFVAHVAGSEVFSGVNARLEAFAGRRGFRKALVRTVHDRRGRPVFEVFEFRS
ncbi:MAG TPA: glycosyltransferase family 39 protein [Bryobacteraceae bacterium]|nr:glycosyltransferase family 39 protein [Bryobacteraceae bacterium]